MKKYIFTRILKSLVSIFIVVSIVIAMITTLIPRTKVLDDDTGYKKLTGDTKTVYRYSKFEELGYLDFVRVSEMCAKESEDYDACLISGSAENKRVLEVYENKGYQIEKLVNGQFFAYHDFSVFERVMHFWTNLVKIDNPHAVQDENNPDLPRKYYIGKDENNLPAVMCSGCNYKYQLYLDGSFPFIHQHAIRLEFGISYPTKSGVQTIDVISENQGGQVMKTQTFPTGVTMESPLIQHSAKYKPVIDHLDENKFDDHYANLSSTYESPSMIKTSYIFGIVSLIAAYFLAIPAGIYMSRKKDKLADKVGIVFINLITAMPSLALIFFIREIGNHVGLPDKFPLLGFTDIRSYITPMVILTLLSMPGLMTWTRRYMIDQSNADYVKFARAKGLSQSEIFSKHILKNAIIPIVNGIPASVILCISGALITESAFAIPGMGKMLPDAIKKMNNNMVVTLVFIFSSLAIFAVLLGDLLMTVVDPRIQLAAKGGKK